VVVFEDVSVFLLWSTGEERAVASKDAPRRGLRLLEG